MCIHAFICDPRLVIASANTRHKKTITAGFTGWVMDRLNELIRTVDI